MSINVRRGKEAFSWRWLEGGETGMTLSVDKLPATRPYEDEPAAMPRTIFGYVWKISARKQVGLALLAVAVFLLTAGPLELQRRIVNSALKSGELQTMMLLCAAYAGLALISGGLKLAFNVYRGWISENAVRHLRRTVHGLTESSREAYRDDPEQQGIGISVVLAESEPVGGFVGMAISEPLLQCGILATVFIYLLYLDVRMAVFAFVLFSLQVAFVPWMQRIINKAAAKRIQTLRQVSGGLIYDWSNGEAGSGTERFRERINRAFRLNMRIYWVKFTMNFLMNLVYHLGVTGILLFGGWKVINHQLEVGTVVAFLSGLKDVNEPWGDLVNYFREVMVAQVKYGLITAVFADRRPDAAAPRPAAALAGADDD
jgi:ABC-type multidrug transport system fused ATPase/permease subunit